MKTATKLLLLFTLLIFLSPQICQSQILDRIARKTQQKIEREAENRAQRKIDKEIDKAFDEVEDEIDGKNKKEEGTDKTNDKDPGDKNDERDEQIDNLNEKSNNPNVSWSRFDFVPGDTVLFEDGPSVNEENGEFPSRWDLYQGGAEIAQVDGEPVITFITDAGNMHSKGIVPYLKNPKEDYLPEVFTIEFDMFFNPNVYNERYYITLHDKKNQSRSGISQITIFVNQLRMSTSEGNLTGKERTNRDEVAGWRHISIAYTKGKLKAYLEDQRLINIPHLEGNPTGVTLSGDSKGMYIKNIRIAKGGVKYYDRVLSEGKIIVNGIKFDVNKATLKPESMGPINKIYDLMMKNPTVNFSVEGHTDSDGNDASNMTLSKARGKSVMNKLIEMGISANRLKSNGFGESKPIDNNSTPEGKANNRRVEFVKFSGNSNSSSSSTNDNSINENNKTGLTFNDLDKKTIAAKLESLPDSFKIPISNKSGIVNGKGTVIIYSTTGGKFGKMEILNIDERKNYEITIKFVTYNYDGTVHREHNKIQIEGTYGCDLDEGYSGDVDFEDAEFFLGRQGSVTTTINPGETAILKILK